ncbi:DUF305 domain-containing protein [Embleya scabrispora]|uniref:DUF305 domain-containing protein n=1 Tax=Embleya scabrispora TaxID=159449 RepID=UPI00037B974B|nr:DUF305 domain-containing protein [Embleya scabrispora]MYS80261.1 DUF305 domain-containing protein [Streptomyces sp. SID5474]
MQSHSDGRLRRARNLAMLALAGTLLLAACGGDGKDDRGGSAPTTPAAAPGSPGGAGASASFSEADVMFAQMMIPHHEQAVEMAGQAPGKAADPEVKRLAAAIEAAQAPEIAMLKGWLTGWGRPLAAPTGHDMGGMMSAAEMAAFGKSSGVEFDRRFLELMIVHHEGAIAMARDELAKGTDPQARKLAEAIRTSQAEEVTRMKRMLASTSGGTGTPPAGTGAPAHH